MLYSLHRYDLIIIKKENIMKKLSIFVTKSRVKYFKPFFLVIVINYGLTQNKCTEFSVTQDLKRRNIFKQETADFEVCSFLYTRYLAEWSFSKTLNEFSLPHFVLPLNFSWIYLDTALSGQLAHLAMTFCSFSYLWKVSRLSSNRLSSQESSPWMWPRLKYHFG